MFQLALRGALKCALRFGEAVGEEIALRKSAIGDRHVGMRRDFLLGCFNRSFKSAGPVSGKAAQQNQRAVDPDCREDRSEATTRGFGTPFPDFPSLAGRR